MSHAIAAEIQVLLEGVPLPAHKRQLIEYARGQEGADDELLARLRGLPDKEFRTLDEVGEQIESVQPRFAEPEADVPRPESGAVPGGRDYTTAVPESGAVRDETAEGPAG